MIAELIPILLAILEAAPQVVADVQKVWALMAAKEAPTVEEQQSIDDALAAAHKALQDS